MYEILKKIDINSLYNCPPYLYTVTILPWEIQKSHFLTVLFIQIITLSQKKQTATVSCTAAYLFTYCCLLLPIICVALFYGQFFYLFGQSFLKPQPALFRVTNIWRNATLPAVRCKSFTFYNSAVTFLRCVW